MIERALRAAQDREHDLVVVGGGVYGALVALQAARRGLRPLLLERDDFGQHTSGAWLRILHGGLRYLQSLDIFRHVESVRERRWFLGRFPDLVEPLPCLMPLYGRGLRRRSALAVGLAVDELLSGRRNRGLRADRALPPGRIVSAAEVRRRAPSARAEGLEGGALWYDAAVPRPQRLLMEILRWGVAEGATALNRVEAEALETHEGKVAGVRARDRVTGSSLRFAARCVVNCAGPWSADAARRFGADDGGLFRPSIAFNVLFDREPDFTGAIAVGGDSPGARTYFLTGAHGGVLAGTHHASSSLGGLPGPPDAALVDDFVAALDEAIPGLALGDARRRRLFWGRLPVSRAGTVELASRCVIRDHAEAGGPIGLVSVSGVKYTVGRVVADRTLDRVRRAGYVRATPDGGGSREAGSPPGARYVPGAEELLALARRDRAAALRAVRALADDESASEPQDVLERRTDWSLDPRHADAVAVLVGEVFDGSPARDPG